MALLYVYSSQDLAEAVSASRSWRGVLRALGHPGTSAGALRAVRRQVDELGLDYADFTGQRRWSDRDLVAAVVDSTSWLDVLRALGLSNGGGNLASVRAAALQYDDIPPARATHRAYRRHEAGQAFPVRRR